MAATRYAFIAALIALVLAAYGAVNFVAHRLLSALVPVPWWAVAALALLSIACVFLRSANPAARAAYFIGMSWMGISLLLAMLFPLAALLRLLGVALGPWALAPVACLIASAYWFALVPKAREVTIEVAKPCAPMRIAQLTDLHLGMVYGKGFLRKAVRDTAALKPDVVVITGDLFDGPLMQDGVLDPLRELRVPVLFISGNHEEYGGMDRALGLVREQGVRVLDGQTHDIGDVRFTGAAYGALEVTAPVPGKVNVLLRHVPIPTPGFDVQLSGHTHRGQLWPLSYLVLLQFPVMSGRARMGSGTLYVSQGTGTWGPPLRLGSRGEITLIRLRARATVKGS